MENSCRAYNIHEFPDLNCENEIEGEDDYEEQLFEEPLLPNDDDLQATNQVQSAELSLEEVERRLEIGNVVENEHIAFALYCKYANMKGFSVRKGKGIKCKDGSGLLQGKFFLCSCEGAKNDKCSENKVPRYQKLSFRCGCKAKLKVARRKGDVWRVTAFNKEHNHELYAPDEAYLIRSGRNITDQQELMLTSMVKSGIPACKAIGYLENAAHGRENLGFLRKDALNCLYSAIRKTKVENGDALDLLEHFVEKSNNESDFYWKMEVDDDQRLMNFFCRDFRSKIDYEQFGDLLSFDTTYRTNKFDLICAPFVGINHHKENIMFGFALMSDETTVSFEWLFKEFLKSMGGKQPGTIYTDQCQAMMNAIEKVFPESHHRLCQWHINQNAPSHFGSLKNDSEFHHLWTKCMKYCETEEEFETTWQEMVDDYKIGDQSWFKAMYKLRHKWATAFSNHVFSAGLLATSRSEGTNSALKKQIGNSTSSLLNCVRGYEEVLNRWRINEKENDTSCRHNKPTPVVKSNPLLQYAVEVYTIKIYQLFEKEFLETMGYELPQQFSCADSSLVVFQVKAHGKSSRFRVVQYNPRESGIKCSCHKFETVGILCSHALKVLDTLNLPSVLEKYIRKRWTKDAKNGQYVDQCYGRGNGTHSDQNYAYEMAFVSHATKEVHNIAMYAKAHEETRDILTKHIACAKKEIEAWNANSNLNDSSACVGLAAEEENIPLVRDPLIAKSRGITNIQKRHWDDKSKKRKGKAEVSKKTGSFKGQSSQTTRDDQPFKDVGFGYSQGARNVQKSVEAISPMVCDIEGNINMGMSGYRANSYPFRDLNMNMPQDWRPPT